MRNWRILTIALLLVSGPAAAQQGSVQVVTATQITTGDPARTGAPHSFEPDFGFSWQKPGTRFRTIQFDVHAVRQNADPRLGRALFAIHDLAARGLKWTVEAGDTAHSPFLSEYGFNNLFAPQVTFRGATVAGKSAKTKVDVTAGRVTVLRDLFGANAEALGQSLMVARVNHQASRSIQLNARASRVRTEDLKEFGYLIQSGDEAGAGVKVAVTPTLQVIADTGYTSYRRRGSDQWEQKGSLLVGTRWTGTRGSLQVNAHRFAPGSFSVMNYAYNDREGLFAAGQFDLSARLRTYGGWDLFRSNMDAERAGAGAGAARSAGSRAYGGLRLRVNSHLFFGGRFEQGARTSRPSRYTVGFESDTGVASGEWQLTFNRWNAIGRYERRSNVDIGSGLNSYNQQDLSGQVDFQATTGIRLFTTAFLTDRRDTGGGGQSYWQASAGSQFQLRRGSLFARTELIVSRNRQIASEFLVSRTAVSAGLSGQISPRMSISLDVFVDRSPVVALAGQWMSRTLVRLAYTLPTGSATPSRTGRPASAPRGTATIDGTVFVDWNGNGQHDTDEPGLPGVGVLLDEGERVTADTAGRFQFRRVGAGPHRVSLDITTVPADFDPPAAATSEIEVRKGSLGTMTYGLVPLGDLEGQVFQDVNGNRAHDDGDQPVEGAVVVLDAGARTEVTREGRFRFAGIRLGEHAVKLLLESLADGTALVGQTENVVRITRDNRVANTVFLVAVEKRPEIRKTFPPKKGNEPAPQVVAAPAPSVAAAAGTSASTPKGGARPAKSNAKSKGKRPVKSRSVKGQRGRTAPAARKLPTPARPAK